MSRLEDIADDLARLALADQERSGEEKIVDRIGEMLGASSQTLQEAYLTAVRVQRAEIRARELLAERAAAASAKSAAKSPVQSLAEPPREDPPQS